jgi:hypothetical protein
MASLTFEIKVPQVVDTHTVELPYFCKYGPSTWAIFTETDIVEVNYYFTIKSACIFKKDRLPSDLEKFEVETITREQFMEDYNRAISLITESL